MSRDLVSGSASRYELSHEAGTVAGIRDERVKSVNGSEIKPFK